MIKSKTLRTTLAVVGVAAMVWGFTAVSSSVSASSGTKDAAAAVTAVNRWVTEQNNPGAAVVAASSRMRSHAAMQRQAPNSDGQVSAQAVNDPDGDGAADEPHDADINDNGVPDDQDPTIASFDTADGFVAFGIFDPTNEELRNVSHDAATHAAGDVNLPYGLLSYDVINVTGPVEIIMVWQKNDSGATDLYKGTTNAVAQYPVDSFNEDDITIGWAYELDDGAAGDFDHVANGTISDPIGPGLAASGATTTTTTVDSGTTTTTAVGETTSTTAVTSTSTSSSTTSTTVVTTPSDPDGDGMANEAPVDLNDNGVNDDHDPTVIAYESPLGRVAALIVDGGQFRSASFDATQSVGNVATPNGLLSYSVIGGGGRAVVAVAWERTVTNALSLYKGSISSLSPYPVVADESDDEVIAVAFEIRDGAAGDIDGVTNGVIVDPVAPGYAIANVATTLASAGGSNTNVQGAVLARTGTNPVLPGVGGALLITLGALLVGIAAKPKGAHYAFNQ